MPQTCFSAAGSAEELAQSLEDFLAEHPRSVLLEESSVLFDLTDCRYSLSTGHGRCVLHLWSEERNLVRTVVGVRSGKDGLRILVRRLGNPRPQTLLLVADRDRRAPAARAGARKRYLGVVERVLARHCNDFKLEGLRSAMDLEHSFGAAYARGILTRGQQCWAFIGINAAETRAAIDGVLTLGILWLAYCREHSANRRVCLGLKVLAPAGAGEATRARMAWLNRELAQWELYELDEATDDLIRIDISDQGNLKMRLVQAFRPEAAIDRLRVGLDRVMGLLPATLRQRTTVAAKAPDEIALSLFGLEFARIRHGYAPDSFRPAEKITFGAGANETALDANTEGLFLSLIQRLAGSRYPEGDARDPLFRLQPERWLESVLMQDLSVLEPGLRSDMVYSQVPAFAASDRGVLDLLTVNRNHRLVILELKADEDLHLALQGLDYWIRVHWLQSAKKANEGRGELERSGYFPGIALDPLPPLLYFVAPSLRVHPAMETILRHLSPAIPWTLIALNEGWRTERKVVFRKRGGSHL